MTDIEIAQSAILKPISEIADLAGISHDNLELYGKYKAKIDYMQYAGKEQKGKPLRDIKQKQHPNGCCFCYYTGNYSATTR